MERGEEGRRGREGGERGFNRGGGVEVERDAGRGEEKGGFYSKSCEGKMGGGPGLFGVPSPSCLQHILHQWCSDWAWHCAMPRCGLPNEPSEARLYLGPGESRKAPLPAGCSLVDWLLAWLPACWLPGWLDIDLSGLESTAGRTLRAGAKSGSGSINVCTCLFQRELNVVDREKERVMVCVSMCVCVYV